MFKFKIHISKEPIDINEDDSKYILISSKYSLKNA